MTQTHARTLLLKYNICIFSLIHSHLTLFVRVRLRSDFARLLLLAGSSAVPPIGRLRWSATAAAAISTATLSVTVAATTTSKLATVAALSTAPAATPIVVVTSVVAGLGLLARGDDEAVLVLNRSSPVITTASATVVIPFTSSTAITAFATASIVSPTAASTSTLVTILGGCGVTPLFTWLGGWLLLCALALLCGGSSSSSLLGLGGVFSSRLLLGGLGGGALGRCGGLGWCGSLRAVVVVEHVKGVQLVAKRGSDLLVLVRLLRRLDLGGFGFGKFPLLPLLLILLLDAAQDLSVVIKAAIDEPVQLMI